MNGLIGLLILVLSLIGYIYVLLSTYPVQQQRTDGEVFSELPIDDQGIVATILTEYRDRLDEVHPGWQSLSIERKRRLARGLDRKIQAVVRLSPTRYSNLSAIARQKLLLDQPPTFPPSMPPLPKQSPR